MEWQYVKTPDSKRRLYVKEVPGGVLIQDHAHGEMGVASIPGVTVAEAVLAFGGPDAVLTECA